MTQHSQLSPERWLEFPLGQPILMIGNEMNRAAKPDPAAHAEAFIGLLRLDPEASKQIACLGLEPAASA